MSVVCARVYADKIQIAADSMWLSEETNVMNQGVTKLVQCNGMTIGAIGEISEVTLMWEYIKAHKHEAAEVAEVLQFGWDFFARKKRYYEGKTSDNEYVLAYMGKVFLLREMSAIQINGFVAIGSGRDFALAALHLGHTPREAVKVACELSCYVSEPIVEYEIML